MEWGNCHCIQVNTHKHISHHANKFDLTIRKFFHEIRVLLSLSKGIHDGSATSSTAAALIPPAWKKSVLRRRRNLSVDDSMQIESSDEEAEEDLPAFVTVSTDISRSLIVV